MIFITLIFVILGFVILINGAHLLVDGASSLAKKLSVSEIAIGLTVISFGTSAPEFSVNVLAAIAGDEEIIFGNVIGSNLMNILLVLGVSSTIYPLKIKRNTIWKEIPFSFIAVFIFMILVNDKFINGDSSNVLTRSEGIILLLFFNLFLLYVFKLPRNNGNCSPDIKLLSNLKTGIYIILGMIGLTLGGQLVERNAVKLAYQLGISHKLVGLTVVAGGTSLPELVTSVVAALKKRMDMAVGNIIGSNIFNIFFVLGASSFISHLNYDAVLNIDSLILAISSLFLFLTLVIRRKYLIERWIGVVFLIVYSGYFFYLIIRK
jgi:cation:H+ antiporter